MDNYAKLVKETHWPTISIKKRREMEKLRRSVELGNRPLRMAKSRHDLATTDTESGKKLSRHRNTRSMAKIDWKKFHNPMVPQEKPKKETVVVDYLTKYRNERIEKEQELRMEGENYRNPYYDWKALVEKDLDFKDYEILLKEKARAIENNARMKEKYSKVKDDFDGEAAANEMLIEALEAKLSILDRV